MYRFFALLAFLVFGVATNAAVPTGGPAPGLWWNPNESGRGFTIEMQDNIMIVTSYVFTTQGVATWYVSAGTYNFATNTFTSTFDAGTGGQCLGCPYVRPQGVASAGGQIRIVFTSNTSGTLYFPGGSTPIVRQMYGYPTPLSTLRGSFVISFNISGLVDGDWLTFNTNGSSSSGPYVGGYFDGFPTSRIAVANVDSSGKAGMLVKIGSFYDFYILEFDEHRLFGKAWVYREGGAPTGNGSPAYGVRSKTPTEASGQARPALVSATATATAIEQDALSRRATAAALQAADGDAAPSEVVDLARRLEAALAE